MKFPITVSVTVSNREEHDALLRGLNGWGERLIAGSEDGGDGATSLYLGLLEKVRYVDGGGASSSMPDAYLEVGGKRMAEGAMDDMAKRFQVETAAHSATVVLHKRHGTVYRQAQARRTV